MHGIMKALSIQRSERIFHSYTRSWDLQEVLKMRRVWQFDRTHLEHSDSQPPPSDSFHPPRPHPTGLISAASKACPCGCGWQPLQEVTLLSPYFRFFVFIYSLALLPSIPFLQCSLVSHNPQLLSLCSRAMCSNCWSLCTLQSTLCNKRSHHNEMPMHHNQRVAPPSPQLKESPRSNKDSARP